jgi:thymidine kinase
MAKLYFRYGVVSSAKTLNLLAVAHNYQLQGKRVVIIKPKLDTRFGEDVVASRSGLSAKADVLVDDDGLPDKLWTGIACVLVDEAQFLTARVVDQLHSVAHHEGVPVICYGLRTDFRRRLFPASQRLFELADSIEEVKTTCFFCNRKATFNQRLIAGDQQVLLGGDDVYRPVCAVHYPATPGEDFHPRRSADDASR